MATLPGHIHVSAYPHCAAVNAVVRRFLGIPASSTLQHRRQLLDVSFGD